MRDEQNFVFATKADPKKDDDGKTGGGLVKPPPKPTIFSQRVFDLTTIGELAGMLFFFVFMGIVAAYAPVSFVVQLLYFILAGFLG